jgi:hypothetical protein
MEKEFDKVMAQLDAIIDQIDRINDSLKEGNN